MTSPTGEPDDVPRVGPPMNDAIPAGLSQAETLLAHEERRATVADIRDGEPPGGHAGTPDPNEAAGSGHVPDAVLFDHDHELAEPDPAISRALDAMRVPPA